MDALPPAVQHDETSDLYFRMWQVPSPRCVALLVHGLGAHSARWQELALFLQSRGIASCAIELKGFGETPLPRGDVTSLGVYLRDLRCLRARLHQEYPDIPCVIVAESMGALLAIEHLHLRQGLYTGAVLMAPAFRSRLKFTGGMAGVAAAALIMPRHPFKVPITAQMLTRDLAVQSRLRDDPREERHVSARLLAAIFLLQRHARRHVRQLRMPILCLVPCDDAVVDAAASFAVMRAMASDTVEVRSLEGMRHVPCIDTGKEKVFETCAAWIMRHAGEGR